MPPAAPRLLALAPSGLPPAGRLHHPGPRPTHFPAAPNPWSRTRCYCRCNGRHARAGRPAPRGAPAVTAVRGGGQDAMATEKLADGIRKFAADLEKLEKIVRARLAA